MLKRLGRAILLSALMAGAAAAANLPLLSGPYDPGNALGFLNQLVQAINYGVTGLLGSTISSSPTSSTSIQTLASYTIPGNQLAAGQGVAITVWGVNSSDANVKTLTFSFGGQTMAFVVTGSGNFWQGTLTVLKSGASTQIARGAAKSGTTNIADQQAAWTVSDTAAINVLIQGTAATSGTLTLVGGYIQQLK